MVGGEGNFTILKAVKGQFQFFSRAFPALDGQISNQKT